MALELGEIIRALKSEVSVGAWQSGKISPSAWPMKTGSLHLSKDYIWRVVKFETLGMQFRVLVVLSTAKEVYRAVLALEDGRNFRVLCHHELHTSHHNWHCHFCEGPVENVHPAVWRDRQRFRGFPVFKKRECTISFGVTKESALTIAAARYRFQAQGEML